MNKISTKPPSGMRDFLPADVLRRRHVISVITDIYESHGFVPLETPTLENLETLTGKYGDEGDQLLYRVLLRRDALKRAVETAHEENRSARENELADLGLRYDLTVPLARVVAEYGALPKYFKRYQISPVWRADRPGKGRFREFYQCDVDMTGTTSLMADAEVCTAVARVLQALGFQDFTIHLNHRELLRAMVRAAGIDASLEGTALVAVDKLDKIGADAVVEELVARQVSAHAGRALLALIDTPDSRTNLETLAHLRPLVDDAGNRALDDVASLLELLAESSAAAHIRLSPALARGLSYYTGPIFEISVPGLAGSLGGGGRYDGLVGMFGKKDIPAVGFSLGLERILVVMQERNMYPDLACGPDLMLCWSGISPAKALAYASQLRAQGLRVEVFPEGAKLGKQVQYADAEGVKARYAAIIAENEAANGTVSLKHLASGEQETVKIARVAEVLAKRHHVGDAPRSEPS
jgi:histidyl-tRNA synthetase